MSLRATAKRLLTKEDAEIIVHRLIEDAKAGDPVARRQLFEQLDGKLPIAVNHQVLEPKTIILGGETAQQRQLP